jgi:hypothetical protein
MKNIVNLTDEEIKKIFEISNMKGGFKIISKENERLILRDDWSCKISLDKKGIYLTYPGVSIKNHLINNAFQVAQYLIDQGYRFEYLGD